MPVVGLSQGSIYFQPLFSKKTNMALVPYVADGFLPMFHEPTRCFTYANHKIEITQNWKNSGVAGVVWDAALVLATFLQTLSSSSDDKNMRLGQDEELNKLSNLDQYKGIKGKNVLELGAGTGLVGIVAYLLGANVVITDTKEALNITKENVFRNIDVSSSSRNNSCEVKELHWGKELDKWRSTSWDFIVGADIVYVQETFIELFETLKVLTDSNKNTCVLLSCRIRYQRDLNFLDLLGSEFLVTEVLHDKEQDVKIFKAKRL